MSLARDGGKPNTKPIPYSKHQGPTNQMREAVGLGGTNHGNANQPSGGSTSGSPGIGGTKHPYGSQDCD